MDNDHKRFSDFSKPYRGSCLESLGNIGTMLWCLFLLYLFLTLLAYL